MIDRITANLPAIDFKSTSEFYKNLGFAEDFRDAGWMILSKGSLELEFFPYVDLNPWESAFSACVRVSDIDALYSDWLRVGLPTQGIPLLTAPRNEAWGHRMFALVDLNGSLLRCIAPLAPSVGPSRIQSSPL